MVGMVDNAIGGDLSLAVGNKLRVAFGIPSLLLLPPHHSQQPRSHQFTLLALLFCTHILLAF